MRTVIFCAGMFIKDGLDKGANEYSDQSVTFLAIIFLLAMIFDVVEFFNNLKKK